MLVVKDKKKRFNIILDKSQYDFLESIKKSVVFLHQKS